MTAKAAKTVKYGSSVDGIRFATPSSFNQPLLFWGKHLCFCAGCNWFEISFAFLWPCMISFFPISWPDLDNMQSILLSALLNPTNTARGSFHSWWRKPLSELLSFYISDRILMAKFHFSRFLTTFWEGKVFPPGLLYNLNLGSAWNNICKKHLLCFA